MSIDEKIRERFAELTVQASTIEKAYFHQEVGYDNIFFHVDPELFNEWSTSVQGLLMSVFRENSPYYKNFSDAKRIFNGVSPEFEVCRGVFKAAAMDYEKGLFMQVEKAISGEVLGDFVELAKIALSEGHKDVAAVLASAALEDALKRFAKQNGLEVGDRVMQDVVAALKSKGLVGGAQKTLLDAMPKIRDYAMHANWDKLSPEDVNSMIGFVEQFFMRNPVHVGQ